MAAPNPPSPDTRARMQAQRRRDTAPELALRRELHRRGRRFFVDRAPLPGLRRRADLLFPGSRVAVFVDGCFWHGCPRHGRVPRGNGEWWREKLAGNAARDRDTDRRLTEGGWSVVRVWEHEPVDVAADAVEVALGPRRRTATAGMSDGPATSLSQPVASSACRRSSTASPMS